MVIPVARVYLAMAHAALPGLLPTPPKSMMVSLQPHPAAGILPSPPKSQEVGRADSDERWDAHKIISPASPATSSSSSSGQRSSPDSKSGSPGRASSCERWDSNKKCLGSKSSPSTMTSSLQRVESGGGGSAARRAPSSGKKCDSNSKRRPASRSPSADRWDLHKKPRSLQAHGDGGVGSDGKETMDKVTPQAIYAGPGYVNSPEPCTLPIPAFMVRAR